VSDKIIVMDSGKIAQQGTPRELYRQPASRFLADFIGDANLVDGEVSGGGTRFEAHGVAVALPSGRADGPATLALRPHRLRLVAAGTGRVAGTCHRVDYLGSHLEVLVDSAWGTLLLFTDDDVAPPAAGSAVGVDFDPGAMTVIAR
jgi:iron(III) transport system ATP-binding protein